MWQTKFFRTYQDQQDWITKNQDRYQIITIYVQNGYAVEFKKFHRVFRV